MPDTPTDGDWVICVQNHEGSVLRERYPHALILSTYLDGLRGMTLRGRVFITALAKQRVNTERLRDLVAISALVTGADPTIHCLDA